MNGLNWFDNSHVVVVELELFIGESPGEEDDLGEGVQVQVYLESARESFHVVTECPGLWKRTTSISLFTVFIYGTLNFSRRERLRPPVGWRAPNE